MADQKSVVSSYIIAIISILVLSTDAFAASFTATQGSFSPTSVSVGNSLSIKGSVTASATANNMVLDLELYNASGTRLAQQYYSGQNFSAGKALPYSWSYTVPSGTALGTYTLKIGVFTANWASNVYWNGAVGTFAVVNPPAPAKFTASAVSFNPSAISPGKSLTIKGSVSSTGTASNMIVDLEIYNASGTRLAQQFYSGQNFSAGESIPYSWSYAIPTATALGTYTLKVGVFTANWASNPYWNGSVGTFALTAGTTTPTATPTPKPTATPTPAPTPTGGTTSTALKGLHVVNGVGGSPGHIVNGSGQIVLLHGVDHTYTEDSCTTNGGGVFTDDGDLTQTDINVMKSWNINIVRVPLNESCWLNINGVPFGGSRYQADVQNLVQLLTSNNIAVILDLHWAAPGSTQAQIGQITMADADHALTFWNQVAAAYASKGSNDTSANSMIIFDLFNEPYIGTGSNADWNCWISGGCNVLGPNGATITGSNGSPGVVTGMAQLLKAVRTANGSPQNVVIMGGLGYSSNFAQWVAKVNSIPSINGTSIANVAASWHIYSDEANYNNYQYQCPNQWDNYSGTCPTGLQTAEQDNITGVLAAGFPVLIGESGVGYSTAQNYTWFNNMLTWMDSQQQGYLSWTWNTSAGPELLSSRNYPSTLNSTTVNTYATQQGQTLYRHLQQF